MKVVLSDSVCNRILGSFGVHYAEIIELGYSFSFPCGGGEGVGANIVAPLTWIMILCCTLKMCDHLKQLFSFGKYVARSLSWHKDIEKWADPEFYLSIFFYFLLLLIQKLFVYCIWTQNNTNVTLHHKTNKKLSQWSQFCVMARKQVIRVQHEVIFRFLYIVWKSNPSST